MLRDPKTVLRARTHQIFLLCTTRDQKKQGGCRACPAGLAGPALAGHRLPKGRPRSQLNLHRTNGGRLQVEEDYRARPPGCRSNTAVVPATACPLPWAQPISSPSPGLYFGPPSAGGVYSPLPKREGGQPDQAGAVRDPRRIPQAGLFVKERATLLKLLTTHPARPPNGSGIEQVVANSKID